MVFWWGGTWSEEWGPGHHVLFGLAYQTLCVLISHHLQFYFIYLPRKINVVETPTFVAIDTNKHIFIYCLNNPR